MQTEMEAKFLAVEHDATGDTVIAWGSILFLEVPDWLVAKRKVTS